MTAVLEPVETELPDQQLATTPRHRARRLRPSANWALAMMVAGYPVWWALGLGNVATIGLSLPLAWWLLRHRPLRLPPFFGVWMLFLLCVVASGIMLDVTAPGTLPPTGGGRYLAFAARLANYLAVTVVLLYVGNRSERRLSSLRVVRSMGLLALVAIVFGLAAMAFPHFSYNSPMTHILPASVADQVGDPQIALAQVQPVLGISAPRPSAPFSFTNAWGCTLALLLCWFVVGWWSAGRRYRRLVTILALVLAVPPIIYSLNRGMWLGLVLAALYVGVRLAARGRLTILAVLAVSSAVLLLGLVTTPLGTVITERANHGHSNAVRSSLAQDSLTIAESSPIIGYGSTRKTLGSDASIAIGPTAACPRCGSRDVGSTGQLTLVMTAQGFVGTALYVLFFLAIAWRYRRDRSPLGLAGVLVVLLSVFFGLFYTALTIPLLITFISIGLLWRSGRTPLETMSERRRQTSHRLRSLASARQ